MLNLVEIMNMKSDLKRKKNYKIIDKSNLATFSNLKVDKSHEYCFANNFINFKSF